MTISNVTVCCCRLTLSKSIDEKKNTQSWEKKIEKHDFEGNSPNNNYLARIKKIRRDPKSWVLQWNSQNREHQKYLLFCEEY